MLRVMCGGGGPRGALGALRQARRRGLQAAAQTVLSAAGPGPAAPPPPGPASAPAGAPPPPPPPPRRAWAAPVALALTATLGGAVYAYRRRTDLGGGPAPALAPPSGEEEEAEGAPRSPSSGAAFPARVDYLLVGGGTAAFAALRALRAARPAARVLVVSEERAPPYMRPPLSKELWREPLPAVAALASDPAAVTFRQWNGRRRTVAYEPRAFYAPVERLGAEGEAGALAGGVALATGWRVSRLDVERREAELVPAGSGAEAGPPVRVRYEGCLLATGSRARRVGCLRAAAGAGRALSLRTARDAARLAGALDAPGARTVAVLGGGFLATELSAALAERRRAGEAGEEGEAETRVVQLVSEALPLEGVLPRYLQREAAARLREQGVALRTGVEVVGAEVTARGVRVRLAGPGVGGGVAEDASLEADVVVECVGAEPEVELAAAAGLETHAALGGVVVNAELQARGGVWAAGDAACYHDVALGRRRVQHHDHAVLSGRRAGENMAAPHDQRPYTHQSMFWSDLGPRLGYEALGIIDSRLHTVGVFSEDAVSAGAGSEAVEAGAGAGGEAEAVEAGVGGAGAGGEAEARRYSRGVVLYVREGRVVGVLLWNLFNRMHVARQVLARGEFADLFEVAKLFAPHEE